MTACWAVAQVHTIGVCGSNAGDWLKVTPGDSERTGSGKVVVLRGKAATVPIKQLLAADKADLILIVLGDTMGAYDKPAFPKSWIWQQATKLTKEIASTGTQCVWGGPNWGTEGGKFGKAIPGQAGFQLPGEQRGALCLCRFAEVLPTWAMGDYGRPASHRVGLQAVGRCHQQSPGRYSDRQVMRNNRCPAGRWTDIGVSGG